MFLSATTYSETYVTTNSLGKLMDGANFEPPIKICLQLILLKNLFANLSFQNKLNFK